MGAQVAPIILFFIMSEKKETLLCECKSTEHVMVVHYDDDPDWDRVYVHIHLSQDAGFWKRLGRAINYLFGHRTKYGDFDEFIINPDDANKVQRIATHLKKIKQRAEGVKK